MLTKTTLLQYGPRDNIYKDPQGKSSTHWSSVVAHHLYIHGLNYICGFNYIRGGIVIINKENDPTWLAPG